MLKKDTRDNVTRVCGLPPALGHAPDGKEGELVAFLVGSQVTVMTLTGSITHTIDLEPQQNKPQLSKLADGRLFVSGSDKNWQIWELPRSQPARLQLAGQGACAVGFEALTEDVPLAFTLSRALRPLFAHSQPPHTHTLSPSEPAFQRALSNSNDRVNTTGSREERPFTLKVNEWHRLVLVRAASGAFELCVDGQPLQTLSARALGPRGLRVDTWRDQVWLGQAPADAKARAEGVLVPVQPMLWHVRCVQIRREALPQARVAELGSCVSAAGAWRTLDAGLSRPAQARLEQLLQRVAASSAVPENSPPSAEADAAEESLSAAQARACLAQHYYDLRAAAQFADSRAFRETLSNPLALEMLGSLGFSGARGLPHKGNLTHILSALVTSHGDADSADDESELATVNMHPLQKLPGPEDMGPAIDVGARVEEDLEKFAGVVKGLDSVSLSGCLLSCQAALLSLCARGLLLQVLSAACFSAARVPRALNERGVGAGARRLVDTARRLLCSDSSTGSFWQWRASDPRVLFPPLLRAYFSMRDVAFVEVLRALLSNAVAQELALLVANPKATPQPRKAMLKQCPVLEVLLQETVIQMFFTVARARELQVRKASQLEGPDDAHDLANIPFSLTEQRYPEKAPDPELALFLLHIMARAVVAWAQEMNRSGRTATVHHIRSFFPRILVNLLFEVIGVPGLSQSVSLGYFSFIVALSRCHIEEDGQFLPSSFNSLPWGISSWHTPLSASLFAILLESARGEQRLDHEAGAGSVHASSMLLPCNPLASVLTSVQLRQLHEIINVMSVTIKVDKM